MTVRATITLDVQAYAFLKHMGGANRSAYINALLNQERRRHLEQAILQSNREEASDTEYQEELRVWDASLDDGLET